MALSFKTLVNLKLVMASQRGHNLLAKAHKCELFKMITALLCNVVSEEGIATDPTKVEKILICTKKQALDES